MKNPMRLSLCLLLVPVLVLSACKHKEKPVASVPAETAPAVAPVATPAPASTAPVAATPAVVPAGPPFDVSTVAMSKATLPPFPYIDFPKGNEGPTYEKDFDRVYVLAGDQLRVIEGHLSDRYFSPGSKNMSNLAAYRNYDQLIKSLGGVQVNKTVPSDPAFIARHGGDRSAILDKMHLRGLNDTMPNEIPTYVQYLIRTPASNIWIAFYFYNGDGYMGLAVAEEKQMEQTVGVVAAKPAP